MGYYVNNEYTDEQLAVDPPAKPVIEKVRRVILAEKPRVTRFAIKWDSEESAPAEFPPDQPEADAAEDDENKYGAEELEGPEDELAEEGAAVKVPVEGEDVEMDGVEGEAGAVENVPADDDAASDAGSEDLEAESSGSEDEEEDDEEPDVEEDAEMGDAAADKAAALNKVEGQEGVHTAPDVMVH